MKNNIKYGFLLLALAGCADSKPKEQNAQHQTPGAQPAQSSDKLTDSLITLNRVKYYDLTGDSAAERLTVRAQGRRYDTLDVVLEIRSAKDSLLLHDKWNSILYFVYDSNKGKTEQEIQKVVLRHIDMLLSDSAFVKRTAVGRGGVKANVDTDAIEYDIKENIWRANHGLRPYDPLPTEALSEVPKINVPAERLKTLVAELKQQPAFTYFSGGEHTTTVAWSKVENRFVKIFECC